MRLVLHVILLLLPAVPAMSEDVSLDLPQPGSVSRAEGLDAFARIYEVTSHPRCANCHVATNTPMWTGPSFDRPGPHGMNITAGSSRIGAEHLLCSTCHTELQEDRPDANDDPHAAPRVAHAWRLPPVEFAWFDKSPREVCEQLRTPETNGGMTFVDLAEHVNHCPLVHWGWAPGGTREPAPYSLKAHTRDILLWGAAAMPCPQ